MAKAVQVSANTDDGSFHAVGVGDLKVMIINDSEGEWYAQALEIDYIAQGTDLEDVKASFEAGLKETVKEHLKLYGDITGLLKPAASEVWEEFYQHTTSGAYRFSQVTTLALDVPTDRGVMIATTHATTKPKKRAPTQLPFQRIAYLEQNA